MTASSVRNIAIVGAGPSGFYAAESLLRAADDVAVYLFEKLPVPYGLVRYGVAPDHPKLKSVSAIFDRIASMPGFQFFGNIDVGRDVTIAELEASFDAIVFACGAERGKKLGIPGEDLPGSFSAHEFVAWYNGHPDYCDLPVDLSCETAAIVGQGNVALDVARILVKSVDELRHTDIADHALDKLAESRIREVQILGRRGPAQVQFVSKELREFNDIEGCAPQVCAQDLRLGEHCQTELDDPGRADTAVSYGLLNDFARADEAGVSMQRNCRFRFRTMPLELGGTKKVESLTFCRTALSGNAFQQRADATDETEELQCGLVVASVGYLPRPIENLVVDQGSDRLENLDGRLSRNGRVLPKLYSTGWAKRGPKGTIGTNRADGIETAACVLADLEASNNAARSPEDLLASLPGRQLQPISYFRWQKLNGLEMERGKRSGRPRVKVTQLEEMLSICLSDAR